MKNTIVALALLASFGAYAHGTTPVASTPVVGGGGSLNNNTGGNAAQQQTQSTQIGITTIAASLARGGNATGGTATSTGGALTNSGNGTGGAGGQVLGSGNLSLGTGALAPAGGSVDMAGAKIGGDTIVPRQVGAVAGINTTQPVTSCRLWWSLFGANDRGSVGGTIPLWKDSECTGGAALFAMTKVNEVYPGSYTQSDFKRVSCTMENIKDTQTCAALRQADADARRPQAILDGAPEQQATR